MEQQWAWAAGKPDDYRFPYVKSGWESSYGRLRKAQTLRQQAIDLATTQAAAFPLDNAYEALLEAEVGRSARAKQVASGVLETIKERDRKLILALAFARAGDPQQAQKLADTIDQDHPLDTIIQNYCLPTIRAAMNLHSNDPAAAVELLRPATKYELSSTDSFNALYPAYIRGLAYLQMGEGRLAVPEFQKVLEHRGIVRADVIGALAHLQLARAQKMMGDDSTARKSYEDFLNLWKDADPDIPIYEQAKAEYAKLR